MTTNPHIGSDFDDFLREEGLLTETEAVAWKRVIAFQIEQEMTRNGLSRTDVARRMNGTDALVERLLDPDDASVTLRALEQAARAVGRTLKVELA